MEKIPEPLYKLLESNQSRPEPFQFYTAEALWADPHISRKMLKFHLDGSVDISSRRMDFIDRSASWIASRFNLGAAVEIADFGCGPGLYTLRFAEKGARVTGIDFSGNSLAYAKNAAAAHGLNIDYVLQNYLFFETDKKFDLITMIMCDFCALSPEQRKKLLGKFRTLLKPEGSVLLDVYTLESFAGITERSVFETNLMDGFWSAENYFGFLNTFRYEDVKVGLDKYTIVEKNRIRTVYNWLQYFSRESLSAEFEDNGFIIREVYSDVAGTPFDPKAKEMAIIACRRQ